MPAVVPRNLKPLRSEKLVKAWHRCDIWDSWSVSRTTYLCMPHDWDELGLVLLVHSRVVVALVGYVQLCREMVDCDQIAADPAPMRRATTLELRPSFCCLTL
ncbi:hypothetical protein NC651_025408 [Populus alba x Populus x berolinensis]|nr:hypothetical protein NC651_025408 [Populus alba x Populus x berolinensis]